MMRSKLTLGLMVVAVMCAGCSSDDSASGTLSQAKVSQTVQTAVIPALDSVQSFLPLGSLLGTKGGTECFDLDDACDNAPAGSANYCDDGSINFINCDTDGDITDGSIVLFYNGTGIGFTFAIDFGDGTSINGTVTATESKCSEAFYESLAFAIPGSTVTFDGDFILCSQSGYPEGGLNPFSVLLMDASGNFQFDFIFNGTVTAMVDATDLDTGVTIGCSVNLDSGIATCN